MNIFEFVKSQVRILDVIQEYTTLKRAGEYWRGLCPFHGEKTPSFTVSPHRGIFYCFGCHASGDVIGFIAQIENYSQIEATKFLAERYQLTLPETNLEEIKNSIDAKEKYFKLCNLVMQWCQNNLTQTPEAQQYITTRQINPANQQAFNLGYFPKGQSQILALIKFVQKQGLLADDLLEAHIIAKNQQFYYSGFEDRLIFPIYDHLGRCCGFGGRVFRPGDDRVKYYNSHEHAYFNKRATLFGLNLAKKAIQQNQSVILVEGYTDCLALHQAGFKNCVATLGTACTSEHIDTLARLASKLYVCYDGDNAGLQAVEKLATLCWNANLEIQVIELPKGEDPASFLNQAGNLELFIKNAREIYQFVLARSAKTFANYNLTQKIEASQKLIELINKVSDPLKRNLLIQEAARSLGLPIESLQIKTSETKTQCSESESNLSLEDQLFTAMISDPERFQPKYHYLASYLNPNAQAILQTLISLQKEVNKVTFEILMNNLDSEKQSFVRKNLLSYNDKVGDNLDQILTQFHQKHWKNITSHIKNLLVQEKSDPAKVKQIIENFQILKTEMIDGSSR
jgi:DNA primase